MNIGERAVEVRHIRAFVTLARTLNFSRAADELYLTQSAMSRTIQELERYLGVTLFVRDHRHVELSAVGAELLSSAHTLLDHFDGWLRRADDLAHGESGTLRIALWGPSFYRYRRTEEALREFRDRHPQVDVEIAELFDFDAIEVLRNHGVEIAFSRQPIESDDIASHVLRLEPLVCILPTHHPLAKRKTLSAADLRDDTVLIFARGALALQGSFTVAGTLIEDVIVQAARRVGVHLQVKREFTQLVSIYAAVENRPRTVAVLPETSAPDRADRRFVVIPFDDPPLVIPYVLLHLATQLSPPARAFVDLVLASKPPVHEHSA